MHEPWPPLLYGNKWIIFRFDSRNYVLVKREHKTKVRKPGYIHLVEGYYFPLFSAIKALLYREMEDKILGNPVYNNLETLLLDLRKALDNTAKEIEVSL